MSSNGTSIVVVAQNIERKMNSEDGRVTCTSLDVAKSFGKLHKNIIQNVEALECSEEFNRLNFQPVEYKDAKGEMRKAYRMTRDGFTFLVMGFTGKSAAFWKECYIKAFNAMEAKLREPVSQNTVADQISAALAPLIKQMVKDEVKEQLTALPAPEPVLPGKVHPKLYGMREAGRKLGTSGRDVSARLAALGFAERKWCSTCYKYVPTAHAIKTGVYAWEYINHANGKRQMARRRLTEMGLTIASTLLSRGSLEGTTYETLVVERWR